MFGVWIRYGSVFGGAKYRHDTFEPHVVVVEGVWKVLGFFLCFFVESPPKGGEMIPFGKIGGSP